MDNLEFLGGAESAGDVLNDDKRLLLGYLASCLEDIAKVAAVNVLHDDVPRVRAIVMLQSVHEDDVLCMETSGLLRLVAKHVKGVVVLIAEGACDDFEGKIGSKLQVLGEIDFAHSALAEHLHNLVCIADDVAFREDAASSARLRGRFLLIVRQHDGLQRPVCWLVCFWLLNRLRCFRGRRSRVDIEMHDGHVALVLPHCHRSVRALQFIAVLNDSNAVDSSAIHARGGAAAWLHTKRVILSIEI